MKITVVKRANDYMAFVGDDQKKWGCGPTENAAIGEVIRTWGTDLGVRVEFRDNDSGRTTLGG